MLKMIFFLRIEVLERNQLNKNSTSNKNSLKTLTTNQLNTTNN